MTQGTVHSAVQFYVCLCFSKPECSDQDEPTYVDALRGVGVRQIACGSGHTVVLTVDGEVYTWGRGDDGRLGHGDNGWKVRK